MNFNDYMKKSRERNNLTQASAAERIGVSVQTIQNWEKDTLPDNYSWDLIIKTYNLNKEEFMKIYIEQVVPPEESTEESLESNFPEFLFSEDDLKELKNLVLTEEEQELLGLEAIYLDNTTHTVYLRSRDELFTGDIISHNSLGNLPYEYITKKGSFNLINLHNALTNKLGKYRNFVESKILENPNKLFNINELDAKDYLILKNNYCIEKYESKVEDILKDILSLINDGGEILIGETYIDNPYNAPYHPSMLKVNYNEHLKEKYKECAHIEYFFKKDEDYLKEKEKYEKDIEEYNKDENLYKKSIEPEYKGKCYAKVSEYGVKLIEWYKENLGEEELQRIMDTI